MTVNGRTRCEFTEACTMVFLLLYLAISSLLHVSCSEQYDWAEARKDWPGWYKVHGWYVSDAEKARHSEGIQLLFYGDSITQCWRFGAHGYFRHRIQKNRDDIESWQDTRDSVCTGAPQVFQEHFGSKYNAKVFGIGGDQTPQMMYRLLHGEGPEGLHTKVAVLLIGTNDLGFAMAKGVDYMKSIANATAIHVTQICDYLVSYDVEVVLMAVLPRGDWHEPREVMFKQPSVFTQPIDQINARIKDYANDEPKVHYVDCGDAYFIDDGAELDKNLLPDALHPSAKGFQIMAKCLESKISRLMGQHKQKSSTA